MDNPDLADLGSLVRESFRLRSDGTTRPRVDRPVGRGGDGDGVREEEMERLRVMDGTRPFMLPSRSASEDGIACVAYRGRPRYSWSSSSSPSSSPTSYSSYSSGAIISSSNDAASQGLATNDPHAIRPLQQAPALAS